MKRPAKLTRKQKIFVSSIHLNSDNWHCLFETDIELTLVHRHTGTIKIIKKVS